MVDVTNFGHDEVFIADCLLSMKKKKDKVYSIQFLLTPRVVSANNQEKEKEHWMEQARTDKFYKKRRAVNTKPPHGMDEVA